jgi:precorrin-8X/cobalt-precorrin-8 methylmutase
MTGDELKGRWGYDVRPDEIEDESFRIIDGLADLGEISPAELAVVRRVIHATGDPGFAELVKWSPGAVEIGAKALAAGTDVVTDVEMARAGVSKVRAGHFGCATHCYIVDEAVRDEARERGVTRSIAAVEKAVRNHPEAIYVFGNAPTALFRLMELVDEGAARPPLIIGTVVGFVGAAESKDALMARTAPPWISCKGNKGGSSVAASCVNALFKVAAGEM